MSPIPYDGDTGTIAVFTKGCRMVKTMRAVIGLGAGLYFCMGAAYAQTSLETLARTKNCLACHAVDKKLVGPSFQNIAAKYQTKDAEKLVAKVQKGGSGTWGPVPMPANMQVTQAEAQTLVTLILALKK